MNNKTGRTDVYNDATLKLLGQSAVSHARAGADRIHIYWAKAAARWLV